MILFKEFFSSRLIVSEMKKALDSLLPKALILEILHTSPRSADCFFVVRLLFWASAVIGVCPLLFFFLARLLSGWLSFVIVIAPLFVFCARLRNEEYINICFEKEEAARIIKMAMRIHFFRIPQTEIPKGGLFCQTLSFLFFQEPTIP